ncbi:hypothetical protein BSKO_05150 [Bryopsis sp. KO-2023]|nr:hypothetical protein BSKO_05150 [Bryopsis sp. KO-2023]
MALDVWPLLDDPNYVRRIESKCGLKNRFDADTAARGCYIALRFLRVVFWQDLPEIFKLVPRHPIFSIPPLLSNWEAFVRWCKIQNSVPEISHDHAPHHPEVHMEALEAKVALIAEEQRRFMTAVEKMASGLATMKNTLDAVASTMSVGSAGGVGNGSGSGLIPAQQPAPIQAPTERTQKKGKKDLPDYPVQQLRTLADVATIRDLWDEWWVGVMSPDGSKLQPGLSYAQHLRNNKQVSPPESHLSKNIQRRGAVIAYVQEKVDWHLQNDANGSVQAAEHLAFEEVEKERIVPGEKPHQVTIQSLRKFWEVKVKGTKDTPSRKLQPRRVDGIFRSY